MSVDMGLGHCFVSNTIGGWCTGIPSTLWVLHASAYVMKRYESNLKIYDFYVLSRTSN